MPASSDRIVAKSPPPSDGACTRCQAPVAPYWVDAVFGAERLIAGTGEWHVAPHCKGCEDKAVEEQAEAVNAAKAGKLLRDAGFAPRHAQMTFANLRDLSPSVAEAVHAARFAGRNLYLFGLQGRGKTHVAAALLREHIGKRAAPGYFYVVPELMKDMRQAVRRHQDDDLIDKITDADALVLDDIGAEKVTDYALERLYLIIDRWDRFVKPRLVVTSNLSPGELSERLDRRLASRLAGMCQVVEMTGDDWRLKK